MLLRAASYIAWKTDLGRRGFASATLNNGVRELWHAIGA